jgi:hypothetical protein
MYGPIITEISQKDNKLITFLIIIFREKLAYAICSREKYLGFAFVHRIIAIPAKINGRLNNCPMLKLIPASNATWSFFTNSMMNLALNSVIVKTLNMKPSLTSMFLLR